MSLTRVDYEHTCGSDCEEKCAAGWNGGRKAADVIAEWLANPPRLQKIALHIDDKQRRAFAGECDRGGFGVDHRVGHTSSRSACKPRPAHQDERGINQQLQ